MEGLADGFVAGWTGIVSRSSRAARSGGGLSRSCTGAARRRVDLGARRLLLFRASTATLTLKHEPSACPGPWAL